MILMKKIRLTTTLALLREHGACGQRSGCNRGYDKLLQSLGPNWTNDKPINLLHILKSNGVRDMLWCLCCTIQDNFRMRLLMSADFAQSVLKISTEYDPKDTRPAEAIRAARDLAKDKISREEADNKAAGAARAAADVVTSMRVKNARKAAANVVEFVGLETAYFATRAAGAAEEKKQARIIRKYLIF
jgi:hypothetical protein